jgi:serine O-acetyltransferase
MKEMGCVIPLETIIESKPELPHSIYGIFISKKAKIGKNCTIFQHVTIGSNYTKDSKGYGFPTIGNNVMIGVGAKIIGNVTVGNNVRIGANAIVTKNIPNNCTVIIGDIKIIERI